MINKNSILILSRGPFKKHFLKLRLRYSIFKFFKARDFDGPCGDDIGIGTRNKGWWLEPFSAKVSLALLVPMSVSIGPGHLSDWFDPESGLRTEKKDSEQENA